MRPSAKQRTGIEALSTVKNKTLVSGAEQGCCEGYRLETAQAKTALNPTMGGQHSRLAYAQAGGIVFEPFFISNDADFSLV